MSIGPEKMKKIHKKLSTIPGVVGVGYGLRKVNGKLTSDPGVVVFVSKKRPAHKVAKRHLVPQEVEGLKTDVQEMTFAAQEDTGVYRPAPGGCSVGHFRITAGTLGSWVRSGSDWMILSNNHVLANSNNASRGDQILQPGPYDNGQVPIAYLEEWIPINFGGGGGFPPPPSECPVGDLFAAGANTAAQLMGRKTRLMAVEPQAEGDPNYVDAALAKAMEPYDQVVQNSILELGPLNPSPVMGYELGDRVQKRGRTTRVTQGHVTVLNATIQVSYGDAGTATFEDQLIIEELDGGDFSLGGDSGSLVVALTMQPYGLLFAGGTDGSGRKVTVINKISRVLEAFPHIAFEGAA